MTCQVEAVQEGLRLAVQLSHTIFAAAPNWEGFFGCLGEQKKSS